jgi:hypothetical protein
MCSKSLTCIHVHCMVVYDVITRLQECTSLLVQKQRLPFTSMAHDSTQKRSKMTYSFWTYLQLQASKGEVSYWKCFWYFEANIYKNSKKQICALLLFLMFYYLFPSQLDTWEDGIVDVEQLMRMFQSKMIQNAMFYLYITILLCLYVI